MKKYHLLFIVVLSVYGCLDRLERREIKIINNSGSSIYCLKSQTITFKDPYIDYNYEALARLYEIKKDSFAYVLDKPRNWDNYINFCDGGKLRLFIITQDSIDRYGWKKVLQNTICIKVYLFSLEDLNKHNWQLVYDER